MKLKIIGAPGKPELSLDVPSSSTFSNILSKAESLSGTTLQGFYSLHIVDSDGNAVMEAPLGDTLESMGMSGEGQALRLVPTGSSSPKGKRAPRDRLIALYQKYDPSRVPTVDAMLAKFPGKEEAVIKKVVEKYGPEPEAPESATPPSTTPRPTTPRATTPRAGAGGLSHRERLIALYQKYDPSRVPTVDAMLAKFPGKEEAVIKKVVEKYGPEPDSGSQAAAAAAEPVVAPVSAPPKPIAPPVAVSPPPAAPEPLVAVPPVAAPAPTPAESKATAKRITNSHKDRIVAIYAKYEPSKIGSADAILTKYAGKEEQIIAKLVEKYGPEPVDAAVEDEPAVEMDKTRRISDSEPALCDPAEETDLPKARAETIAPEVPSLSLQNIRNIVAEPQAEKAPPAPATAPAPIFQKTRFLPALDKLMKSMATEKERALQIEYFHVWRSCVCKQRAKKSQDVGLFVGSGPFEVMRDGNVAFTVSSIVDYFDVTNGTDSNTVLSRGLSKAIQELSILAQKRLDTKPSEAAPELSAVGLLVHDSPDVASSLAHVLHAVDKTLVTLAFEKRSLASTLEETQSKLSQTSNALSDIRLYADELEAQAIKDQTSLLRLAGVERELQESREREAMHRHELDVIRQARILEDAQNAKQRQEVMRLRKELADERKGLPSDMETLLAQKDQTIATLQQELSRVRVKAKGNKDKEDSLHNTIRELSEKVSLLESSTRSRRGASASASPRGAASSPRSGLRSTTTLRLGETSSSPMRSVVANNRLSVDFEPAARAPPTCDSLADATYLAEDDDPTLDVELQKKMHLPDRGACPHCLIPLTAFMGNRYGSTAEDSEKVAFCFSCRRSFTGMDLARRDAKARSAQSALGAKTISQSRV